MVPTDPRSLVSCLRFDRDGYFATERGLTLHGRRSASLGSRRVALALRRLAHPLRILLSLRIIHHNHLLNLLLRGLCRSRCRDDWLLLLLLRGWLA